MSRLLLLAAVCLCAGCATRIPYTGTLDDVERAIAMRPRSEIGLSVESRGDNWVRYQMVRDAGGIYVDYGLVRVKVSSGHLALSGSRAGRALVQRAVHPK